MALNIFEALRESHERQRELCKHLFETSGDTPERHDLFEQLKTELLAHELAEERHFYIPLMAHDAGVDLSRHAISEHQPQALQIRGKHLAQAVQLGIRQVTPHEAEGRTIAKTLEAVLHQLHQGAVRAGINVCRHPFGVSA